MYRRGVAPMTRAADLVRARAEALDAIAAKHETAFGAHADCCAEYAASVCRELAAQIDALPAEPVETWAGRFADALWGMNPHPGAHPNEVPARRAAAITAALARA